MGRQFPIGAGRSSVTWTGPRAPGGRNLCGQYRRSDRGSAWLQHAGHPRHGNPASPAAPHCPGRDRRGVGSRLVLPATGFHAGQIPPSGLQGRRHGTRRDLHRNRCPPYLERGADSARNSGIWAIRPDLQPLAEVSLCRRRHECLGRSFRMADRRADLPRQRQGRGIDGSHGHALAGHAGTHSGLAAPATAFGSDCRIWRWRHRRLFPALSRHPENRHLRNRTPDSQGRVPLLWNAESPRARRFAHRSSL